MSIQWDGDDLAIILDSIFFGQHDRWINQGLFFIADDRHWENYVSISFHIEWDMIVVTVFVSILNQMEFHLVQDHIPFNFEGNGNIVFSVSKKFYTQNDPLTLDIVIFLNWHISQGILTRLALAIPILRKIVNIRG